MPDNQDLLRLLHAHPAWRPLSFIQSLNQLAVAGVLGHIVDPRWHIDPDDPDSIVPLEEVLGLTEETQADAFEGMPELGMHQQHLRCKEVLNCWKNRQFERNMYARFEIAGPRPVKDCNLLGFAPYDFIWRKWGEGLRLGMPDVPGTDPVIANLRASRRFISFLRHTWVSELYHRSHSMPEPTPEKVLALGKALVQASIPVRSKSLRGLDVGDFEADKAENRSERT